jgi:CSLREA domain-containing protein
MGGVGRKLGLSLATIGAAGVLLSGAASASAATITVSSTADPIGTASQCTLRQAIESANTDTTPTTPSNCVVGSGADTITFGAGILPATINLANGSGELASSSNVTIQGPGLTLNANNGSFTQRVFHVTAGSATLSGLTLTGGHIFCPCADPTKGGAGIAVETGAALTLDDAAVVNNDATYTLNGGTFPIAQIFGGGIKNSGDLTVTDTTVSGNTLHATTTGDNSPSISVLSIADGAGIESEGAGNLSIARSAITGNTGNATSTNAFGTSTTETQGAVFVFSGATSASITGSTIANNTMNAGSADTVFDRAGGIFSDLAMTLTSDTVTGNDAAESSNLRGSEIIMTNTIIAEPLGGGSNCEFFGSETSAGYNWSDDATCDPNGTADVASTDPHLLPLGDNGGPTQTRRPAVPNGVDPSVMDQGFAASQTTDQRGFQRTWNFGFTQPTGGDGTDVGAVEVQGPTFLGSTPASPGDGASPSLFGRSEKISNVQLFDDGTCTTLHGSPITDPTFASPGFAVGPFAVNTATTFSATTSYGIATSDCSDPFTYQRRPALPTLTSTNPASGGNNNDPKIIGTATTSTTVNIYKQADCTGPVAGTGTDADLAGTGIQVSVPDNSTTSFYAQATGVGGTSDCSTALSYTEVTPPPPTPPTTTTTPPTTPAPPATKKKCKKAKKGSAQSAKKKCKKKK